MYEARKLSDDGPDPFHQHLEQTQPITAGFVASVKEVGLAMVDNPIIGSLITEMYPDPRSMVN